MAIIPVGSIVAYAGKSAPKGWLFCDGKDIPSETAFKLLRDLVAPSKKTPDLRGYFLRGFDTTKPPEIRVDPDTTRGLLSIQQDAVGPHEHGYLTPSRESNTGKSGSTAPDVWPFDTHGAITAGPIPNVTETRPKNVAVNYIIKATDEG